MHKESHISCSSCEAEVKTTDECIKNAQMFCHLLSDLQLLDRSCPIPVYNDNGGSVDWSNSFSTKGMRHVNICENSIQEAHLLNEVSILHIPGNANPADLLTMEFKSKPTFWSLWNLILFYPSSFPSWFAPCLDGGIRHFEISKFEMCISSPRSHTLALHFWLFPFITKDYNSKSYRKQLITARIH